MIHALCVTEAEFGSRHSLALHLLCLQASPAPSLGLSFPLGPSLPYSLLEIHLLGVPTVDGAFGVGTGCRGPAGDPAGIAGSS